MEVSNTVTLMGLSIVQARCVTRGLATDPNALYLIEITDGRGVLHNQWFKFPLNAMYNIRAPAYPQSFYENSLNEGATWTWRTMIQNIWEEMKDFLGPWPDLPSSPSGTPEGFWFKGVPGLIVLCNVLEHIGMRIAHTPTLSSPFRIVRVNAADAAFAATTATYVGNLEDDQEWLDIGAGRVPGSVIVMFQRRNSVYGTEETVTYKNDSMAQQWATKPMYSVEIDAPSQFTSGSGKHHIWSDFTVRYDDNSEPLAADVLEAQSIAQERVDQYYESVGPEAFMSRDYAGAVPFTTGSLVDGVCWYQDYSSNWHGWRTKIVYGPDPPWGELQSGAP
jgi:hypothetical protein